jgi:hypothetical protein
MDQYKPDHESVSEDDKFASKRSSPRDSLLLSATLEIRGMQMPVRIRNLSAGGCMAEYPHEVELHEEIRIDVRGIGWVIGRIAWAVAGRIGIAFAMEIDPKLARKPVVKDKRDAYPSSPPPRRAI